MLESKLKIVNELGLHARATAQLVRLAEKFKSRIKLKRNDINATADAKSILSILALGALKGVELELFVEGEDEKEALAAIEELFASGFGEL